MAAVRARKGSPPLDYSAVVHLCSGVEEELGRQIELDLPRTFADQRDFAHAIAAKDDLFDGSRSTAYASSAAASAEPQVVGGGDVHDALRRILRLFCVRNPGLGYLQSMNFVAAFMLLVFGRENEGEAYACFETLVCDILEGWYTQDMGMLRVSVCGFFCRYLAGSSFVWDFPLSFSTNSPSPNLIFIPYPITTGRLPSCVSAYEPTSCVPGCPCIYELGLPRHCITISTSLDAVHFSQLLSSRCNSEGVGCSLHGSLGGGRGRGWEGEGGSIVIQHYHQSSLPSPEYSRLIRPRGGRAPVFSGNVPGTDE